MTGIEELIKRLKSDALEALDNMDDYARMDVGVDAHGPRGALEKILPEAAEALETLRSQLNDMMTEHGKMLDECVRLRVELDEARRGVDKVYVIASIDRRTVGHGESCETITLGTGGPYSTTPCPAFPTRESAQAYLDSGKRRYGMRVLELPVARQQQG